MSKYRKTNSNKKERRSRIKPPKIYLNFNSRTKTLTFRPLNPTINTAELREINETNKQPRNFSMAVFLKDVVRIVITDGERIHVHAKVAKYLLVNSTFSKALLKEIKSHYDDIDMCHNKVLRARSSVSRKNWELRLEEHNDEYTRLIELRDILYNLAKEH